MTDVTIIGGGIVGLSTARPLLREENISVRVLEKESGLAQHQSTHNSGVLHAGLQYMPGSSKARLAREGIRQMTSFCAEHNIEHEICGKLVVASNRAELPLLEEIFNRGVANGLQGLRRLSGAEAKEIEPHVNAKAAILVPEEGIADYGRVCATLEILLIEAGADIVTGAEVRLLERRSGLWRITTTSGVFESRMIVNCAGLHSDRIVTMAGGNPGCRIVPFRGEYHRLSPEREHLVRHLIYPLPEPGFPFLGVHFTRRTGGGIDAGPNAVLAFAREGYDLATINLLDLSSALTFPGLWYFVAKYPHMVARELGQSFDRRRFVTALQRLVPEVSHQDLVPSGSGVRAQAMDARGELINDFVWSQSPGAVHVINAPSPAATASLVIGGEIATQVQNQLVR